ncbi:MAG: D-glycero-beta-D-manno-heptose 1-phosphate adenylyltransferase [Alphaproteobacteria bacterium]|nr:D-glycero-beta-D-manno-heptose 1-phosphate adenylyltransferase [Alphaproteobacteria bacterium]
MEQAAGALRGGEIADSEIAGLIPLFVGRTVLVLGDVMLDRYVSGEVSRISPEAPIPVLRVSAARASLGGAANVAHNVAALGARAILIGVIGDDDAGAEITRLVTTAGNNIDARLFATSHRPTTVKTRFTTRGAHQLLRVDDETVDPLDVKTAAELRRRFSRALTESDVVVLSDYAKGVLCDRLLRGVVILSRKARRPVIADPKRGSFKAYRNVTVLTPNSQEVTRATGVDAADDNGAERAARMALDIAACDAVIVTRSEHGLTLVRRGMPALHLPARVQEVSDVSGAGDTFVAGLAAAFACGPDLERATRLANIAAGISVARPGTAVVSSRDLAEELHRRNVIASDEKVMVHEAALQRIGEWRRNGLRIGFTNGCFDLIHPGHVHLLAQARAACDRLVVALNTDASVRRLKGPERPIQSETARATVMSSLASVDLVLLFDEDTPLSLIEAIRPDVLVKGADYRPHQVVGADTVRRNGGKVLLVDLLRSQGTTATIARVRERARAAG